MRVYNTLGREKQEFVPIEEGKVRMYTCGPTVYGLPHIGNYRSFFMGDMIRRYLEYIGYEVTYVMNITDIDDKTIRDSKEAGEGLKDFTQKYERVFFDGLDALNIKRATHYPRATEAVPQMINLIKQLVDDGIAYVVNGSVYFSISKFPKYGKLSGMDLEKLDYGCRVDVDEYEKDQPGDFALWKRSTQDEIDRGIFFESPWGQGRPGWHIECSAMGMDQLGEAFDVHTGGVDLIFPHHENEIAQAEAATGKQFVKYWLHGEHLIVDGRKMSKSKGNYFTLTGLLKKHSCDEVRYLFLTTHYRDKLDYTEQHMQTASEGTEKLKNTLDVLGFIISRAKHENTPENKVLLGRMDGLVEEFEGAMDEDFDTPRALRVIHEMSSEMHKYLEKHSNKKTLELAREKYLSLLHVFGLFEKDAGDDELEPELVELIEKREKARRKKDFESADAIREQLKRKGILLNDYPNGTRWKRI